MKTRSATIRIPEEMVNKIDEFLMPYGDYKNRPEFMVSAIRTYLRDALNVAYAAWNSVKGAESDTDKLYLFRAKMKEWVHDTQTLYEHYRGDQVTIILHVSPVLIEIVEDFMSISMDYGTFQNFTRIAIMMHIDAEERFEQMWEYVWHEIKTAEKNVSPADEIKGYESRLERMKKEFEENIEWTEQDNAGWPTEFENRIRN